MKNIIIGGTTRSGKTTLANLLREKFSYSKCECDAIISAFSKSFPDLNINHKDADLTRENFQPFMFELLNGFNKDLKYTGNVTIFPGAQFLPKNLSKYENVDSYIVIFLGLDGIKKEDLLKQMRKYDTLNDWTYKKSNEWLLEYCESIINESNSLKKECEKYNFYYFNTYNNRNEVFKQIFELVEREEESVS